MDRLELQVVLEGVLEQGRAGPEQDWDEMDRDLVYQPGREVLLSDVSAAHDRDDPVAGGS